MGKTLSMYFDGWGMSDIAQLYVCDEVPNDDSTCVNYYRVTDKEALFSIVKRNSGRRFSKLDIDKNLKDVRKTTGVTYNISQKARKRTAKVYLARNLLWRLAKWDTKKLWQWVDDFDPEAIFLASGDYSFIYNIALKIAKRKNVPLYVSCVDDFYLYNKNEGSLLGRWHHKLFMKRVKKTMEYATAIFTICDKMSNDYSKFFNKPCYTLHTGSEIEKPFDEPKTNKISYLGNVSNKRFEQLIEIGKTLMKSSIQDRPQYIDVYSAETRPEIIQHLTKDNGINFCGKIDAEQVKKVIAESMLLIHTESFDEKMKKTVAYSVSTKIADSLSSGTCLLAYGPEGIASMDYLIENQVAFCVTKKKDLPNKLDEIIGDKNLQAEIVRRALLLAAKNHKLDKNTNLIKQVLGE